MHKIVILAVLSFLFASPVFAQDKATIEARDETLMAAFNKGDAAAVRAIYTDDAVVLPSGGDMVRGKGLLPFWKAVVARIGGFKRVPMEVTPLGPEYAREIGTFAFASKRELTHYAGKYVVIWQNVGGEWRIATDIWNMNEWPERR